MKLSKKAIAALRHVYDTDNFSARLTRTNAIGSQELVDSGMAVFIKRTTGENEVALKKRGIEMAESLFA